VEVRSIYCLFSILWFTYLLLLLLLLLLLFGFYASAVSNHSVAGDILFWSCSSVHPCIRVCVSKTITQYLEEYLTHFHQTYVIDALWDRDESAKI